MTVSIVSMVLGLVLPHHWLKSTLLHCVLLTACLRFHLERN